MAKGQDGFPVWPVWKQVEHRDLEGLGERSRSLRTEQLAPRTIAADKVVSSICPHCAVGCGQLVYVKDEATA